ncbi:hypothetical protein HRI_003654900 [Hibiscus trionum]|uniref:Uncharacterized protein n=1 Tax=Hibiscus trionum TaxID=183268 RepID=A0A9W7IPV5_HIBTR|nr:hypothetical protein HRI_003654900 [Hibiscus trionum]
MGGIESKNRSCGNYEVDGEGTENSDQLRCTLSNREPTATVIAVAALAVGLVVCGVIFLGSRGKKTMKAPGRSYRIFRDDFKHDPASYFRGLRKSG